MADKNYLEQKIDDVMGKKGQTERQLNTLIGLSERFGASLSNAFAKNTSEGTRIAGRGRVIIDLTF